MNNFLNRSLLQIGAVLLVLAVSVPAFADKLVIPLGKAVSLKITGVKKIMAVKNQVVEILNVSDQEVIISGVGANPDSTQLIFWSDAGKSVYDVETYNENKLIQEKFDSLFGEPGVTLQFFPDAVYLRGAVDSPSKVKTAEEILNKLVEKLPIVTLIEVREGVTIQQRIADAIKIPTVKVTVIDPREEVSAQGRDAAPGNSSVATMTSSQMRIILEGTVKDQNEFMRMTEVIKGFVPDENSISNLVTIIDPLQVVFQAYILQVNKDNTKDLGVEWGGTGSLGGNLVQGTLKFFENTSNVYRGDSLVTGAPVDKWPNPLKFNNINRFDLVSSLVKAWESKSLVKVISSPKLLVYANASLRKMAESGWAGENTMGAGAHGDSLAYVRVSQRISYNGPRDTQGISAPEYIDADLTLAIRDLFIKDGKLKFSVFAQQDDPVFKGGDLPPDIFRRSVQTTVRIDNEQTIVLGGLINHTKSRAESRVPLLSSIPVVGKIFRNKSWTNRQNELVIILTPKIQNREFDLAGKKKFETVPVPRRTERLEEIHQLFQDIKKSNFPGKSN